MSQDDKEPRLNAYVHPETRHAAISAKFTRVPKGGGEGFCETTPDWMGAIMTAGVNLKFDDLSDIEKLLYSQAVSLDAIYVDLAAHAVNQLPEYLKAFEILMRLGLKAQSQSRATLQTLVEMKMPKSITITKQANFASQQVVNNGHLQAGRKSGVQPNAHTGGNPNSTNELLDKAHDGTGTPMGLDTGTAATASRVNPAMATVEKKHGRKNTGREKA